MAPSDEVFELRTELLPGDQEAIVRLHGEVYSRENGFDRSFEEYVAGPLAQFAQSPSKRSRIWLIGQNGILGGVIAIVEASPTQAQLRWFVVAPRVRGLGLGKLLLREAIFFARERQYESVFLWTVSSQTTAARLYQSVGFQKVEQSSARLWGVDVIEEKYEVRL